MIKIIKEGQKEFITACLRCGCEFSYEISDIKGLSYICCPCCGEFCNHHYITSTNLPNQIFCNEEIPTIQLNKMTTKYGENKC